MTFEDTMYEPEKKPSGNPDMKAVGLANKGKTYKLKSTKMDVKFQSGKYYLPGDMEIADVVITVNRDELADFVADGAKWEQLEQYYQVSQTNLKEHFSIAYAQARAKLEMELLKAMKENAKTGSAAMQKWLSQQWLGMSEELTVQEEEVDIGSIDEKLQQLLNKAFNLDK